MTSTNFQTISNAPNSKLERTMVLVIGDWDFGFVWDL